MKDNQLIGRTVMLKEDRYHMKAGFKGVLTHVENIAGDGKSRKLVYHIQNSETKGAVFAEDVVFI